MHVCTYVYKAEEEAVAAHRAFQELGEQKQPQHEGAAGFLPQCRRQKREHVPRARRPCR